MRSFAQAPLSTFWLISLGVLSGALWISFGACLPYEPVYDDVELWGQHPAPELHFIHEGLSLQGVQTAFTTRYGNIWQPVVWLSHMADSSLFGAHNLPAARAVNLCLHLANALVICFLYTRWLRVKWIALILALLWLVHPLRVESVVWLTERKDVLSTFLLLCTLCFFHLFQTSTHVFRRILSYIALLITFTLALGAKASTLSFTGIALILNLLIYEKATPFQLRDLWRRFSWLLPIFIIALAYLAWNLGTLHTVDLPLWTRVQNALASLPLYLQKTLLPTDLSYFYPYPTHIPLSSWMGGMVLLGAALCIAWYARRTLPLLTLGILWVLGSIFPMLGLIQVGEQGMADRYTYLPSIGLGMILFSLGKLLNSTFQKNRLPPFLITKTTGLLSVLFVCLIMIFLTRTQITHWKNETTLYSHALQLNPENHHALLNLALTKLEKKQNSKAESLLKEALKFPQVETQAAYTLATLYHHQNSPHQRLQMLQRALKRNPTHGKSLVALGWHYADLNQPETAESFFLRASQIPTSLMDHPRHLEYATFLFSQERHREALIQARLATELPNPDPRAQELLDLLRNL